MHYDNIFTNNALKKMAVLGISEAQAFDVYNSGDQEKASIGGFNAVKKYPGYEIGVYYIVDSTNKYKIVSVWKRSRR